MRSDMTGCGITAAAVGSVAKAAPWPISVAAAPVRWGPRNAMWNSTPRIVISTTMRGKKALRSTTVIGLSPS
jgi:hypothetical protein